MRTHTYPTSAVAFSVMAASVFFLFGAILFIGCTDDTAMEPSLKITGEAQSDLEGIAELEQLIAKHNGGAAELTKKGKTLELPAGSNDALAAAIAAAGKNGAVKVKAGQLVDNSVDPCN
jgi:hypothetical protein